jgi:polar amino acid transport system substrate-binding protein
MEVLKMKKKIITGVLLSLMLVVSLITGCTSSNTVNNEEGTTATEVDSSTDEKVYLIACDAKYAPFSFEEDGVYKGIDVELLAAIAEVEGFKYELKPMDFSGIIPAIKANQIDGSIAGMNITEARKESVDFSDGYIQAASSIVTHKDNTDMNSLDDLQGKTAAVKKGTTGSLFAEANQEKYNLEISYFDDSPSMFQAVENKNCDFLVEDFPVIAYKIKVDENSLLRVAVKEIEEAPYDGFAVNKGENQELLQMFNEGLQKLKDNGKYDEIVGQYVE